MPTIADLEQSLTDAANAGDMGTITSIVSSLTPEEKAAIDPAVFGYTLSAVANYTATDPTLAASTAGTFMQEVGIYTDSSAIVQGYTTFAWYRNLDGVDEMVNNTDPQIYSTLNSFDLGQAIFTISFSASDNPDGAAATAANFLSHLSAYTDPGPITSAMQTFASYGSLAGVDAVLDNIEPQIFPLLEPSLLSMTLTGILSVSFSDPSGAAATMGNFLSHLSLYLSPYDITGAIQTFAQFGNLDGVNEVLDNIDPQVYSTLDPGFLGQALQQISSDVFLDHAGAVATAANFLSHLSLYTDPSSIAGVMQNFAQFGALDGVNAVIDNIDPQIYSSLDPFYLGQALTSISFATFQDPAGAAATAANFLSHLSLYTDPSSIAGAMGMFAQFGNLDGANAVIDNIDPQVYPTMDPFSLGMALMSISFAAMMDPAGTMATTADFLSHLSLYTDPFSITYVMQTFAATGLLDGVNAVVDNTDPQVYSHLDPFGLDQVMTDVASATFSHDDHDVAGTLGVFSHALLPYTSGDAIEQSLQILASDGNLSAFGAVLDYATSSQWDSLSASFKDSLPGLGITVGTYLDDKYLGSSGPDTYFGLGGNDNIDGKAGDDILFGNAGNDKIAGGGGNDTLVGGIGADVLTGGAGSDTFVLSNDGCVDKIQDFDTAAVGDKLDFRDMLSGYDGSHPVTDYIHAHSGGGNTIISFDADGAGPGGAVDIAKLQGVAGIDIQALFDHGQILI